MSVTRLSAHVDAGAGVPLRRALLYVVVLLGSNLATFLLLLFLRAASGRHRRAEDNGNSSKDRRRPRVRGAARAAVRAQPQLGQRRAAAAGGPPVPGLPGPPRPFLSYPVNGSCPDDELPAQRLMLRGCEPLPRHRCRPAAPRDPAPPLPFPDALWSTPPDRSIHWSAYTCKSFRCLVDRARSKRFDDCKDCFDLAGREHHRWLNATTGQRNPLNFSIDEVLASASPPGSVRIGLDISGGSGTFVVRMRERGVTVVATTVNLNGSFAAVVAARGIVPLYVSVAARLPFFDNTLDIVHSMHVLSGWMPAAALQFALFDVYRVLRPGGLFWLDHFFCGEAEMAAYVEVVESVGFRKVRWVTGRKLDRGAERRKKYLSALLEKPLKNSW